MEEMMFTGLVEEMGKIKRIIGRGKAKRFEMGGREVLANLKIKDSINVNGACLTVVGLGWGSFVVEAVEETLKRTNLGDLKPGEPVNLERGLKISDRLGGHIVLGHTDCVGRIESIIKKQNSWDLRISIPDGFSSYIVEKGSVAVDGISLTVVSFGSDFFKTSLIPYTFDHTTLGKKKVGDKVNVEFDILGKYIEKIHNKKKGKITYDFLKDKGW